MKKQAIFKTKGMQKDLSVSAFNSEYSYENKNIRIMPTDESTLLSIINEKGNLETSIEGIDNIIGTPIGKCVINDKLILFTKGDQYDYIYKIYFNDKGNLEGKELVHSVLNFDTKYPIETLAFYENDNIEKVYWTDGKNSPRVINVADGVVYGTSSDAFDFVPTAVNSTLKVDIKKDDTSQGMFSPGVIQYAVTYFNKYGVESNIVYTSPLYYISYNNRGASPEEKVSISFTIDVSGASSKFDYIRIYSIHRTSINAIPTCKRIADLTVKGVFNHIIYTDNGLHGDIIDPTELLYVGGESVIFGTMTHKDNVLFAGDIKLNRKNISNNVKNFFKNKTITFKIGNRQLPVNLNAGYYQYDSQLKFSSDKIKTFKYLETYRFGIQFQHETGKWSEPVFIHDEKNTVPIKTNYVSDNSTINLVDATLTVTDSSIISELLSDGYIKARPVIVYPQLNERECVCQGILCPTVFNVADRYSNSPFVQASWFTRPNAPFNIGNTDWKDREISNTSSNNSRAGIITNDNSTVTDNGYTFDTGIINNGTWAEFRHYHPIPSNNNKNAEIQCIWNPPESPFVNSDLSNSDISSWVSKNSENYYIDKSILTFHSPDIEFNEDLKNIDSSNLKLRIVGIVPLTSFISDVDIQTSTPPNSEDKLNNFFTGFYKEQIGVENISRFGYRSLISAPLWRDTYSDAKGDTNNNLTGFAVYPWHRNGSLNNAKSAKDGYRPAMLDKKKMSNLRYSINSFYLPDIWTPADGISGVTIFDSNEVSIVRIPAPKNSGLPDLNYYGNIDKVINISRTDDKVSGYPIIGTGNFGIQDNHMLFQRNYRQISEDDTSSITGTDPVRMKYKSTSHAVIALNYSNNGDQNVLPTLFDNTTDNLSYINYESRILTTDNKKLFWDKNNIVKSISQNTINYDFSDINNSINGYGPEYGWLYLAELYNDNVQNKFGGVTDEAFENNQWLPCGNAVSISSRGSKQFTITWTEGDTYYQRYDNLKTYPFTLEDQNSVVDIISFMCETRVNIDGRYDKNRGQLSNLVTTPQNFNLLNPVYSQSNNFFNYRGLNPNLINLDNFHNVVTWTKTKSAGELVDTWTNITLASTLDLDGDKGTIRALKRFNNNIISFQDTGISHILYNENTQISSTEGVPIEIANSGKVYGKRYISNNIGCRNKWSICETTHGLYFIDDLSKGIYLLNDSIDNISDRLGFHSWINKESTLDIWNPVDFNNFVTYYDKVNGDVFFINADYCLALSEPLGQFSSFYSYEKTPYFVNLTDRGISFRNEEGSNEYKAWLHNEGDYNMFFGKYQPFYTTVIVNPDMPIDKIFNIVEFRADSWNKEGLLDTTFDTLTTWNEYQSGTSSLINLFGKSSQLKKKFRIWRALIPRDKNNNRDRMRNPWLYVKLSMENENTNKTVLHDMTIHYFE